MTVRSSVAQKRPEPFPGWLKPLYLTRTASSASLNSAAHPLLTFAPRGIEGFRSARRSPFNQRLRYSCVSKGLGWWFKRSHPSIPCATENPRRSGSQRLGLRYSFGPHSIMQIVPQIAWLIDRGSLRLVRRSTSKDKDRSDRERVPPLFRRMLLLESFSSMEKNSGLNRVSGALFPPNRHPENVSAIWEGWSIRRALGACKL